MFNLRSAKGDFYSAPVKDRRALKMDLETVEARYGRS